MSVGQRFSVGLSVLNPEGEEIDSTSQTHIPIHFLREHQPKAIARFASPSCPWPWAGDTESDERPKPRTPPASRAPSPTPPGQQRLFTTFNWAEYPQALFPNWTAYVVERCGMDVMFQAVGSKTCKIYPVDVLHDGRFVARDEIEDNADANDVLRHNNVARFMESKRTAGVRLRSLCIENISGSVLKMLGTYYRIEPFFWSSAINRIPSRYHEELESQHGDHMYITLPFLRMTKKQVTPVDLDGGVGTPAIEVGGAINVFAPLTLVDEQNQIKYHLQQDMLAVLMIRVPGHDTIITAHPGPVPHSARTLHDRIFMAGKGIYWGNLIRKTSDPIFIFIIILWNTLYSWDEAMEVLYSHITKLEARVIRFTLSDIDLSPQLHAIRAHLLYYDDLLYQFKKSLEFIDTVGTINKDSIDAQRLLAKEVTTLSNEVDRLRRQRDMQDSRLSNVLKMVFSILNIKETQTSLQHGESMKQITYLTMIYLPASFLASIFGMNVVEITPGTNGTFAHYFAAMIPLTAVTVWLAVAVTGRVERPGLNMFWHIAWPVIWLWHLFIRVFASARVKYVTRREKFRPPAATLQDVDQYISRPRPSSRSVSRANGWVGTESIRLGATGGRTRPEPAVRHSRSSTLKKLGAELSPGGSSVNLEEIEPVSRTATRGTSFAALQDV